MICPLSGPVSFSVAAESCVQLRAVASLTGVELAAQPIAGEPAVLVSIDRSSAVLCASALAYAASVLATMGTPDRLPDADRMLALAGALTDAVTS